MSESQTPRPKTLVRFQVNATTDEVEAVVQPYEPTEAQLAYRRWLEETDPAALEREARLQEQHSILGILMHLQNLPVEWDDVDVKVRRLDDGSLEVKVLS